MKDGFFFLLMAIIWLLFYLLHLFYVDDLTLEVNYRKKLKVVCRKVGGNKSEREPNPGP